MRALTLLMLLMAVCMNSVIADAPYSTTSLLASQRLNTDDGLTHEAVLAITRDDDGVIWLGTNGGIQSFDGKHFTTLRSVASEQNTLPGNGTFAIYKGSDDYLWAGIRNGGLVRINIFNHEIMRVTSEGYRQTKAGNYYVLSICEDNKNNLWAATSNGLMMTPKKTGVARFINYDKTASNARIQQVLCKSNQIVFMKNDQLYALDIDTEQVLQSITLPTGSGNNINDFALAVDETGHIYAGSANGIAKITPDLSEAVLLWPEAGQPAQLVRNIIPTDDNRLWLATETQGAVLIDRTTGLKVKQLTKNPSRPNLGLHNNSIYDMLLADDDILWIAGSGIEWVSLNNHGIDSFAYKAKNSQSTLESDIVSSHMTDDGTLWQLSLGSGVNYQLGDSKQVVSLSNNLRQLWHQQFPNQMLYATVLQPIGDGNFWLSANKGFLFWDRKNNTLRYYNRFNTVNQQPYTRSLDIIKDRQGMFWFTQYGGALYYDTQTDQFIKIPIPTGSNDKVVQFLQLPKQLLVLSTRSIYRLDKQNQQLIELTAKHGQNSALSGQFVAMRHFGAEQLWITGDGGLTKAVLKENDKVTFEDVATGHLNDNTFHSLEITPNEHVWLSSSKGIYKYTPNENRFDHYSIGHGVTTSDFYDRSSFTAVDGRIYFGGVGGWVTINPSELKQQIAPPTVSLWSMQVGNQPKQYARRKPDITMDMAQHWLKLEFSAIDFRAPNKLRYAFLLEGADSRWRYTGNDPSVSYTGLSPGNYVLHVKAASVHSQWHGAPLQLPITVMPPWYRSTLAYLIYTLLCLSIILNWYWRRLQLSKERQRYLKKIERSERQMKLAIWGSGDAIWDWNIVNNHIERLGLVFLGYDEKDGPNTPAGFHSLVHPDDQQKVKQTIDKLLNGQLDTMSIQYRVKHHDGRWCWVADNGKVVEVQNGKPARLSGTLKDINHLKAQEFALRDLNANLETKVQQRTQDLADKNGQLISTITTLEQTQNQLVEAEKMASLGKVVAGLAHEMNTPLGITTTAASCLETNVDSINEMVNTGKLTKNNLNRAVSAITDSNKLIVNNTARTAQLVTTFKQLSIEIEQTCTVEMPEFIEQAIQTFEPSDSLSQVNMAFVDIKPFKTDSIPEYLLLVLSKLYDNSIHHGFCSSKPGIIHIDVEKSDSHWSIVYSDNGQGLPEDTIQQIFEPFYTTKRHAGFTGLGMHIVYNLVTQALKGSIRCRSNHPSGLMVSMRFPL